jgi:hypothetical protein
MCLNKIKCKLGFHKWEYSHENFKIVFQFPGKLKFKHNFPDKNVSLKVRICKSCYKKQRLSDGAPPKHWIDCSLNRQQSRDKLLDELI